MKKLIKFKFICWFYNDVKTVIESVSEKESIRNNLWLAAAFIYIKSNERRDKPCQFKYLCFKDIKKHANNVDDKLLGDFISELKDKKIITVNQSYSVDKHYSKQYAVSLKYKEQLLDLFHTEQIIELRISNNSFKEWQLLTKEQMFNILNEEIITKEEDIFDELKENPYEEYEKNSFGYHQGESETEKILHQRMLTNFNFDKEKIREHINNSSKQYEQINKLSRFVKSTKHRTYSSIHGRVYLNGYSNGSKEFRDTFKYDDNALVQLMDVKSCFVLLTVILAKMSNKVDNVQIEQLYHTVTQDDIYQRLADLNNSIAFFEPQKHRDIMKKNTLRWFFMSNEGKKKCGWSKELTSVKNYFKNCFPSYYKWLTTYKEITVDGKKKNCLAIDCQWLQNYLIINTLMKKFINYKVITLHDSLWISKDQYSKELKNEVQQYFNRTVEGMLMSEQELREQIEQVNCWRDAMQFMSTWTLSKDFIREIEARLPLQDRIRIQQQIYLDTIVIRVKTAQYFQNAVTWLQNCCLYTRKELRDKFQYDKLRNRAFTRRQRQVVHFVDGFGRVLRSTVF